MEWLHLDRPLLSNRHKPGKTKITTGMSSWGNYEQDKKGHKLPFWRLFGCRSKNCSWSLHMAQSRGRDHPNLPSSWAHIQPTHAPWPSLHLSEPAPSFLQEQARYSFLVLAPWYCSMGPKRSVLVFLSGLINFSWLASMWTWVETYFAV